MIELIQGVGGIVAALLLIAVADRERLAVASRIRVAIALCLLGIGAAALASWAWGLTIRAETRETVLTAMVWLVAGLAIARLFGPRCFKPRSWK